ncbi:MAG TPA: PQQ-dependent sugar dehydrogenase [Nitrososphaeraceae archaeon]|nr:PQQ-dependent sugar dehydrogenase [Nitrososphaeraceae archaeon]
MSRSVFSAFASVIVILFLYCFPIATNYFDNRIVDSTSTSHFVIPAFGQRQLSLPQLNDEDLRVEPVIEEELLFPTSMVFVDNDTLLVTQKNDGNVISIINGTVKSQPAISVEVNNEGLKGLLGIAAMEKPSSSHTKFVFLYFTESHGGDQTRNRVYRYEWDRENQVLVNGTMILDLPAEPESVHNGGKLEADRNGNLYAVIGDLSRDGQLQNVRHGPAADDTSVIIRIIQNGSGAADNPFFESSSERMQKYYAYGIRNSFGLAIDPISGLLWDTENGPDSYDEMNIVHPGFNSGWNQIMGPISHHSTEQADLEEELMIFDGSKYADPVFSWKDPVGLTDLEFLNSTALGPEYAYNLFVGDINNGNLYYFELNDNRIGIELDDNDLDDLTDQVADDEQELSEVVFGSGFEEGITDIETGPDGFLYILTFNGNIYRILPITDENRQD